jgi:hypothetical protein
MNDKLNNPSRQDLPKIAKGAQPSFFDEPALEAMHGMIIILLEQVCVLNDRLDTYERLGEQGIVATAAAVEAFQPEASVDAFREQRRQRLIDRMMRPVRTLQEAAVQNAQSRYEKTAQEISE